MRCDISLAPACTHQTHTHVHIRHKCMHTHTPPHTWKWTDSISHTNASPPAVTLIASVSYMRLFTDINVYTHAITQKHTHKLICPPWSKLKPHTAVVYPQDYVWHTQTWSHLQICMTFPTAPATELVKWEPVRCRVYLQTPISESVKARNSELPRNQGLRE